MLNKTALQKWLAVAAVILMVIFSACGGGDNDTTPSSASSAGDGLALLEGRCVQCHGLDKVEGKQKTQAEWEQTVTRMVEKGASLNAEEQETLVAYLAETYGP